MVYCTMLSETRQNVIGHICIEKIVGSDGDICEN